MKPSAIIGAVVAGGLGALLWAGIAIGLSLEIGYVAWAVGGLVGFGSVVAGGRGPRNALACAAITCGAILAGKAMFLSFAVGSEGAQQVYQALKPHRQAFAQAEERDYPEFMVNQGFSSATGPELVSPDELSHFQLNIAPLFKELVANPKFTAWSQTEAVQAFIEANTADLPIWDTMIENLDLFDVVFMLLGIATAHKVGMAENVGQIPIRPQDEPKREEERESTLA
ncbi:MAG: hypothetical protein AAF517_06760 [Planctomycetota bacterium]